MSHSQANLKPRGLRKRKAKITVTDDELQRQKHSKITAGDGPERIDSTAMAELTDETEPDVENKILIVDLFKIEDLLVTLPVTT